MISSLLTCSTMLWLQDGLSRLGGFGLQRLQVEPAECGTNTIASDSGWSIPPHGHTPTAVGSFCESSANSISGSWQFRLHHVLVQNPPVQGGPSVTAGLVEVFVPNPRLFHL